MRQQVQMKSKDGKNERRKLEEKIKKQKKTKKSKTRKSDKDRKEDAGARKGRNYLVSRKNRGQI